MEKTAGGDRRGEDKQRGLLAAELKDFGGTEGTYRI